MFIIETEAKMFNFIYDWDNKENELRFYTVLAH